ncbi:MAG: FAD-binding domain-containing protein [Dermatophilaceae bacterium]
MHAVLGPRIWEDIEPYKTGRPASEYSWTMPADVEEGRSGLACVDAWQEELVTTGYLHNHARMWLASYLVHHRLVAWQAGARWFLTHLLDGDPASNNLSWQWVASTWRRAPYVWNRANLLDNGGERYCSRCPLRDSGCPFDTSYAELTRSSSGCTANGSARRTRRSPHTRTPRRCSSGTKSSGTATGMRRPGRPSSASVSRRCR